MYFKYIFSLIVLVVAVGIVLVVTGESKMNIDIAKKEKRLVQEKLNSKIFKIMTSGKYRDFRAKNIEKLVNSGREITKESVDLIFELWLQSVQQREGDFLFIHFSPDMLSEEHKEKFKRAIAGINREEVIDKLKALNIAIDHSSEKITGVFRELINPKFDMFHKSDMAIHWLEYFLAKKSTDVNAFKRENPMLLAITAHNYDAAKLLIKYGYKVNNENFESIQGVHTVDKMDDTDTIDQKGAFEALSNIKNLLLEHLPH